MNELEKTTLQNEIQSVEIRDLINTTSGSFEFSNSYVKEFNEERKEFFENPDPNNPGYDSTLQKSIMSIRAVIEQGEGSDIERISDQLETFSKIVIKNQQDRNKVTSPGEFTAIVPSVLKDNLSQKTLDSLISDVGLEQSRLKDVQESDKTELESNNISLTNLFNEVNATIDNLDKRGAASTEYEIPNKIRSELNVLINNMRLTFEPKYESIKKSHKIVSEKTDDNKINLIKLKNTLERSQT